MSGRKRRIGKANPRTPRPDLLDVVARGAVVRRHQFITDFLRLLVPALACGLILCVIYASFILRANRSDWNNLAIVCAVLLTVPFAVSAALAALRTRDFPFSFSALLTFVAYNIGVVVLSALRIRISYSALFWGAPVAIIAMVLAAGRLRRGTNEKLAILDFPGAAGIKEQLGKQASIITDQTSDTTQFDRILIDGATHHSPQWTEFLTRAYMRGASVVPWIRVLEQKQGKVNVEYFDVSHLAYSNSQIYYTRCKRFIDLLTVVLVLPVALPLGILVWLYIRLIDGGPSMFVQTRRGYAGKNFRMLKFRTMRIGTHGGSTLTTDKRILPGCKLLRRLRLDELPQIINILRGEMSWIGPRPVSLEVARECEKLSPAYINRYLVPPGISGWAQVTYGYAGTSGEELEKLGYDLYYLKNVSFDLDVEIILRTIRTLLTSKGAR